MIQKYISIFHSKPKRCNFPQEKDFSTLKNNLNAVHLIDDIGFKRDFLQENKKCNTFNLLDY